MSPTWPSKLTEFLIHPQPETWSLRWNLSTASGADGWGKTWFPITHHRKQAACKERARKKKKKGTKWKTERRVNQNSPECLSLTHTGQHETVPHIVHLWERSLLATGQFLDLKLTIKFPLGLGGGRWEKSSQLCFQPHSSRLQFQVEAFPQNMENDQETM